MGNWASPQHYFMYHSRRLLNPKPEHSYSHREPATPSSPRSTARLTRRRSRLRGPQGDVEEDGSEGRRREHAHSPSRAGSATTNPAQQGKKRKSEDSDDEAEGLHGHHPLLKVRHRAVTDEPHAVKTHGPRSVPPLSDLV